MVVGGDVRATMGPVRLRLLCQRGLGQHELEGNDGGYCACALLPRASVHACSRRLSVRLVVFPLLRLRRAALL